MFDQHIICEDGFSNISENGKITGFVFLARLPYYRGLGLSMIEDVGVTIDGAAVPRSDVRFSLRGQSWMLDELETNYDDRWNFGEKAQIIVERPGGLAVGKHLLEASVRYRVSYLPFVPTTKCSKELVLSA